MSDEGDIIDVVTAEIMIPNVRLDLDDLLALVRRLNAGARQRVAQALADTEMDSRLSGPSRLRSSGQGFEQQTELGSIVVIELRIRRQRRIARAREDRLQGRDDPPQIVG